jgi:hypothetical protein
VLVGQADGIEQDRGMGRAATAERGDHAGVGVPPARTLFVSGNPWDSHAALVNGFAVVRINRGGDPDEYDLHRGA